MDFEQPGALIWVLGDVVSSLAFSCVPTLLIRIPAAEVRILAKRRSWKLVEGYRSGRQWHRTPQESRRLSVGPVAGLLLPLSRKFLPSACVPRSVGMHPSCVLNKS